MEVNIKNIIIMLWVEKFQELFYLITSNLFDRGGVQIWNKLNLIITINYGMMIKYIHNILNHMTGFGRRGPVFEENW